MFLSKLNHAGDTILEVLICVAVAGGVLAGAYVSANRSFASSRRSQERGEALKLVETQIERLKTIADDETKASNYLDGTTAGVVGAFCLDATLVKRSTVHATCADVSGRYDLSITRAATGSPSFTILASWDGFGNTGNDQIQLNYMVYQR